MFLNISWIYKEQNLVQEIFSTTQIDFYFYVQWTRGLVGVIRNSKYD